MLAPNRSDKWICADSTSLFKNPTKYVHILLDWFNIDHDSSNVDKIEQIYSIDPSDAMVKNVMAFCTQQGLTLTLNGKPFGGLFSCTDPEPDTILIVVVPIATTNRKMLVICPKNRTYYMLMLLFQDSLYMLLPFSHTNMNLHLGKLLRNNDYGKFSNTKKAFNNYMKHNVNQKISPIQGNTPSWSSVER